MEKVEKEHFRAFLVATVLFDTIVHQTLTPMEF